MNVSDDQHLGQERSRLPAPLRSFLRRVTTPAVRLALADAVAHPGEWAIVLDYDGTVAPFVKEADQARPGRVVAEHLHRLPEAFDTVAFISGRPAAFVHDNVGVPGIEYIGLYGAEVWDAEADEATMAAAFVPYVEPLRAFIRDNWTAALDAAGVSLEDKGAIMTLHWRAAEDAVVAEAEVAKLAAKAVSSGWYLTANEMNVEIRPPIALTKEDAAMRLLATRTLRGVILLGDEASDMRAWAGAKRLQALGAIERVVRVGVASDHTPAGMHDEADLMVADVRGVATFLGRLADGAGIA